MARLRGLIANRDGGQAGAPRETPAAITPIPRPVWSDPGVRAGAAVVAMLAASAAFVVVAPTVMPASYSWTTHGISESAAQGVDGAWMARTAFLLFGLAVIWLARQRTTTWRLAGTALHTTFGLCMLAVAAFSTKPWQEGAAYVRSEDMLHTVFASIMGFAFIGGTASVLFARQPRTRRGAAVDLVTVLATLGLSLGMGAFPGVYGVLQRLMFGVAYSWYAREALAAAKAATR